MGSIPVNLKDRQELADVLFLTEWKVPVVIKLYDKHVKESMNEKEYVQATFGEIVCELCFPLDEREIVFYCF